MYLKNSLTSIAKKAKQIGLLDRFIRYHPLYYTRALRAIKKFNGQGMPERKKLAEVLRDRALLHASKTPYGRQFGSNYDNWPVLEKTVLRDSPGICSHRSFSSIPASTGGTTGLPLNLLRSVECIAVEQAFIDNLIKSHGVSFRSARIAILRADEVKSLTDNKPPFGVYRHKGKRLILSSVHMSRHTIDWFVAALQDFRPQVLWVYPGTLASMLRLMDEAGLRLKVPIVLSSSESMAPELSKAITKILSAKVIDYYGQGERVCLAYATQVEEYWFSPAYGYVELQPEEEPDADNGTRTARIIATTYWNNAMPLIRYNTGDFAVIPSTYTAKDLEEVAFGVKPFLGIAGRSNEFIVTQDGRDLRGLNHIPRDVEHILRLQIVQNCMNKITIRVLANSGFNGSDRIKIIANARNYIPPEIDVVVEVVDSLESMPNGKTPFVIRNV
ncbi:MAG: hypothetical protein JKY90_08235 [Gammaproteobacteria bacterium]|nr:hypothetical protein [Gammaproteobacteria bacterium]